MTDRRQLPRLRNPMTGEIRICNRREASRLRSYGWIDMTMDEWFVYQQTVISHGLLKAQGKLVRH